MSRCCGSTTAFKVWHTKALHQPVFGLAAGWNNLLHYYVTQEWTDSMRTQYRRRCRLEVTLL
jgi:hypothetical protein